MVQGVFRVYRDQADLEAGAALPSGEVPDLRTFVRDMHLVPPTPAASEYDALIAQAAYIVVPGAECAPGVNFRHV